MKVYTAIVGPCDGEWFPVEVPEVPGVFTQGRDLVEVEEMAREAIAMMLDVPIGEVAVRIGDRRYRAAHRAGRGAATPSERRESLRGLLDAHVAENDVFTAEELAEAREALYGSEPEDPRTANS